MKYRKKPALTEATQWFHNGDHPQDRSTEIPGPDGATKLTEGKVVRFFRSLTIPGGRFCPDCGNIMQKHGVITNGLNQEEETVCPGDYIITDQKGRYYRLHAHEFEASYEPHRPTAH